MPLSNDIIAWALTKFLSADSLEKKRLFLEEQEKVLLSDAAINMLIALMKQYESSNDAQQIVMAESISVHVDLLLTAGMVGVADAWTIFAQELKISMEKGKRSSRTGNEYTPEKAVGEILEETQRGDPERAILLAESALQYFTLYENDPQQRAFFQFLLGDAYIQRVAGDRRGNIEQAISYYQEALSVLNRDLLLEQWAAVQHAMGEAYTERIAGETKDNLEQAIEHFKSALLFYNRKDFPQQWAGIQGGLGDLYQKRIVGAQRDNLERAISYYEEALQVFTRQVFPPQWAAGQRALGDAYINRIAGVRKTNLERAIGHFQAALQVFTYEAFPRQWANTQMSLGDIYQERIEGTREDNLERAITHYEAVLQVYTHDSFPYEWGKVQLNLGNTYVFRVKGEPRANIEQAIICYKAALQVHTREYSPRDWTIAQICLSNVYLKRVEGESQDNIEQAIACCEAALHVCTRESFPTGWASIQVNLGRALTDRMRGEGKNNLQQAISCFEKAQQIYTFDTFPREWAGVHMNLGGAYYKRIDGERKANLQQASTAYQNALQILTFEAFPGDHRKIQLNLALVEAERQDWEAVHKAYTGANEAEDLLVRLGAGALGRDTILKEGRGAAIRDGFALARLGEAELAAVAIERGRARGLAEALMLNAADPKRITDRQRRERYLIARQEFIEAQSVLNKPLSPGLHERNTRQILLRYVDDFHKAQKMFNAVIDEIREAKDPVDFLNDTFDATTILRASACGGVGHALVYLLATPWGGVAVAASNAFSTTQQKDHFLTLDLPALTEYLLADLLGVEIGEERDVVIHGLSDLQEIAGFSLFAQNDVSSDTFRDRAAVLNMVSEKKGVRSTFVLAAQKVLQISPFTALLDRPFNQMTDHDKNLLATTFSHCFLQLELERCLAILGNVVMRPLIIWLKKHSITSVLSIIN